jgi:tetratricopeptide (TPR) repeat protein
LKKADERGWHAFPGSVYRTYTKDASASGESPEVLSVFVDFFVEAKDYNLALAALNRSLGLVKRHPNVWMSLDDKFSTASKLKDQTSAPWVMHTATGEETVKEATALVDHLSKLIAQRECLSVAADLDATAAKLEERDLFAKAEQLYRESVQIKKKNLGPKHVEVLSSLVALARVLSMQDKFAEAASTYAEALALYSANKSFRDRSYGTMLESYAQVLVRANKTAQADKIYAEAREFYRTR